MGWRDLPALPRFRIRAFNKDSAGENGLCYIWWVIHTDGKGKHEIYTWAGPKKTHPRVLSFDGERLIHQPGMAILLQAYLWALGCKRYVFVGIASMNGKDGQKVGGYTVMGPNNKREKWDMVLVTPWTARRWSRVSYVLAHEAVHVKIRNRGRGSGHGPEFRRVAAKLGIFDTKIRKKS